MPPPAARAQGAAVTPAATAAGDDGGGGQTLVAVADAVADEGLCELEIDPSQQWLAGARTQQQQQPQRAVSGGPLASRGQQSGGVSGGRTSGLRWHAA